jgi:hypothetical protein
MAGFKWKEAVQHENEILGAAATDVRVEESMFKTNTLSVLGWAAPILLATAGPAAAEVFSIDATLATVNGVQHVSGSDIGVPPKTPYTSSQGDNALIPGAAVTVGYSVIAGQGFFGSESDAAAVAASGGIGGTAEAIIGVTFDHLTISDPFLLTGTPLNYTINFGINGSLKAAAFGGSSASALVALSYGGVTLGEAVASTSEGLFEDGIFSHGTQGVIAQTPVVTGFVDHDFYVTFGLDTHAAATAIAPSINEQGQAQANADFLDPFSLPTDGPVFNFFDANGNPLVGATVNSADGCIVNNMFMCGSGTSPGSVPELSTWLMMLVGFAGLGLAGWRRGRRQAAAPIGEEIGL